MSGELQGSNLDTKTNLMQQTLRAGVESSEVDAFSRWNGEKSSVYAADVQNVLNIGGMGLDSFGVVNFARNMIGFVHTKEARGIGSQEERKPS